MSDKLTSMFFLPTQDVVLDIDLPRFRKEMGDVTSLAVSIEEKGQLQPIVIDDNNRLICGGRRLAACILLGKEVLARRLSDVSDLERRELELLENIERKQFTPAEEAEAIAAIHAMRQEREGGPTPGCVDGWSLQKTAEMLGKSKSSVARALETAAVVAQFPELKECKTQIGIQKAAKAMVNRIEAVEALAKHEEEAKAGGDLFEVHNMDFREHIKTLEDESVDVLFTDPVYGIEFNSIIRGPGGKVGGVTAAGEVYDDSKDNALDLIRTLAMESIRITKPTSHGYVFVGPENFHAVQAFFVEAGWEVYVKPIIWIKRQTGQNNQPSKWPSSCYEMAIYMRREKAEIVKQGFPDWVECPPVNPAVKVYPGEKPVDMLKHLLQRVTIPSKRIYDPFMGSGALLEAGFHEKQYCIGCDISVEAYAIAMKRMCGLQKAMNASLGK